MGNLATYQSTQDFVNGGYMNMGSANNAPSAVQSAQKSYSAKARQIQNAIDNGYLYASNGSGGQSKDGGGSTHLYESFDNDLNQYYAISTIGFVYSYDGDLSEYSSVHWVQTVNTNYPIQGKKENDVDRLLGDKDIFYDQSQQVRDGINKTFEVRNFCKGSMNFADFPSRPADRSFYWQAQLSLIGVRLDGSLHRIHTVSWGFYYDRKENKNTLYPLQRIDYPSPFHQHLLNNPNQYKRLSYD